MAGVLALFTTVHGALQVGKLARFAPGLDGVARRLAEATLVGFGAEVT